jgi:hypothetical protein
MWMNKYVLTYEPGWMGGRFLLDGNPFGNISSQPKSKLIINNKEYETIYKEKDGFDYDMGHEYSWRITDIGIIDGNLKPRFLSVKELMSRKAKIYIEFL